MINCNLPSLHTRAQCTMVHCNLPSLRTRAQCTMIHCSLPSLRVRVQCTMINYNLPSLRAQDSLCLMQLLHDLGAAQGWRLVVGHCNHQWREDASANASHVRMLAGSLGLQYCQVRSMRVSLIICPCDPQFQANRGLKHKLCA